VGNNATLPGPFQDDMYESACHSLGHLVEIQISISSFSKFSICEHSFGVFSGRKKNQMKIHRIHKYILQLNYVNYYYFFFVIEKRTLWLIELS
jgi:hypothetical protein